MGTGSPEWLKGLPAKEISDEDRKIANETLKAERAAGIEHPELNERED